MHSPDENQLWCPGQSLWSLIAEHVSQTELLNIRQALGHSLVDMYTEVHSEAEMLHNMWQDSRCYGNHRSGSGTCRLQGSPLSDPPAVKELVRAEVKMLLETLKERACKGGRYLDGEELLLRCQPETLNYVLGHQEISYRRSSNLKTAENFNSRPSSSCSVTSRAESEIDAVKDKLTVTEIHRVIARLRCVILEECEALAKTTKHFKESINQKFVSQPDSHKPEPSLAELKELRADIQTHLELLPSSAGASSSALGQRPRKSVRPPAESSSDTRVAPTPKSGFKPDLPPLWHRQPRPPRHDPPNRTSSVRTLGLHRFTKASNESVKPSSSNSTDSDLKVTESQEPSSCSAEPDFPGLRCTACSRLDISCERNPASPENHSSTQCCVHRPSPDFDWSPRRERKIRPLCSSRNINITSSPLPAPLGQLCDASSSSPGDRSVSEKAKIKAEDRNNSSSGRSSVLTPLQKDKLENTSGISVISGTIDQVGSKKNKRLEIKKVVTSKLIPIIKEVETAST